MPAADAAVVVACPRTIVAPLGVDNAVTALLPDVAASEAEAPVAPVAVVMEGTEMESELRCASAPTLLEQMAAG